MNLHDTLAQAHYNPESPLSPDEAALIPHVSKPEQPLWETDAHLVIAGVKIPLSLVVYGDWHPRDGEGGAWIEPDRLVLCGDGGATVNILPLLSGGEEQDVSDEIIEQMGEL